RCWRRISTSTRSTSGSGCTLVTSRAAPSSAATYTPHQSAISGTVSWATRRSVCSKSSEPPRISPARWRNRSASLADTTGDATAGIRWAQVAGDQRAGGGRGLDEAEERAEVARGGEAGHVQAGEAGLEVVAEHGEAVGGGDVQPRQVGHAGDVGLIAANI